MLDVRWSASSFTITMNLVWLVSIFVICNGTSVVGALKLDVINLGAIFSFSTINGQVSRIAMQAAQDDINSDPSVLGGRKLSIAMHDSRSNGFLSIMGALQFMETDIIAIIGPQSSMMAHVLSHMANELQVPLLSFTALDPTLSPLQYPFLVQTVPNDLYQMTALAEMVSYFGWREVVAIFSDDDEGRNGAITLGDKLAERRCKISNKYALPPDKKATETVVRNELVKVRMMESRVIVLHTNSKTGLMVFNVAQRLGMMESGYVWIATTWLSTVIDSRSPLSSQTATSILGALTLRPHTPDSKKRRDFVSRWNKLSNGSIGLNPYGLYAYDTVWMIARALKLFLDQGNTISFSNYTKLNDLGGGTLNLGALSIFDEGKKLLTNILQTNMTGLSGPIRFRPDRSLLHPSFDIINVIEPRYSQQIGYWSNYSGLSVVPPEKLCEKTQNRSSSNQHLYNVVWPGGVTTKPRGWVFPNNGRQLRIGVPNRASFRDFVFKVNGTDIVQGYCIDVFLAAVSLLPYAVPFKFIPYGDGHKNPSFNELIDQITSGVFDAAVGDIAIVMNRTKAVDFTQPYIESGLVVVAPARKLNSSSWTFLLPFNPFMWAVAGFSSLVVGTVVWILEHRSNDEFRGPLRKQIVTVLWFSLTSMCFAHRENTVSSLGRFVVIIWLFVVLIINSSYTASLTSFLTVQQLSSPIQGIDTLITSNDRVGFQVGSYAENYLIEELSIPKSRLVALGSPEEYAIALKNGTVAAVVDERPYVDMFLSNHCQFSIRGQEFTKSGWGFAFPRDSPLAIDMSTAILTLSENGKRQRIHDKWLRHKSCGSQSSESGSEQLQIQSFLGLFLICGIACFLALILYLCLILYQFKRYNPEESDSSVPNSSRSTCLQTFLSFADEKVDRTKSKSKRKREDMSANSYMIKAEPRNGSSSGRIQRDISHFSGEAALR